MKLPLFVCALFIFFFSSPINPGAPNYWTVWDVGQGLWVTYIDPTKCVHFDMGGEYFPSRVSDMCFDKKNYAFFSHWDWDHIGFISQANRKLKRLCVVVLPNGKTQKKKTYLFSRVSRCHLNDISINSWTPETEKRNSNANSRIFFNRRILLPGDSPQKEEKVWSNLIPKSVETLILGHHGSKTSTSKHLLNQLMNVRWAIASARRARYDHPHSTVSRRLKNRGIALLRTEDWGNIYWSYFGE